MSHFRVLSFEPVLLKTKTFFYFIFKRDLKGSDKKTHFEKNWLKKKPEVDM